MIEKLKKIDKEFLDENGVTWQTEADYLQIEILGFCGCGDPDDTMFYVKEMLEKLGKCDWEIPADKEREYMFFVYWANDKGFAEHGTTARCSWLTDVGEELLTDINKVLEKENSDG